MALIYQPFDVPLPADCRGGALTIGNFDGVHRGHHVLLHETAAQARAVGGPAVALTFEPHPQQLLRPDSFLPELTTLGERARLLQAHGVSRVLVLRIAPAFLQWTAADFFERLVRRGLEARAIVEGFNFGFGHGREGDPAMLQKLAGEAGIALSLVPPVEFDGKPISTSRIREELRDGNVVAAAGMLGRAYRITGVVGPGQRRGQGLGFPTANLGRIGTLVPGDGVYAVRVTNAGQSWPGAANIGGNPTFGDEKRKVEVHLIGFNGSLYGKTLSMEFVERIRPTRRFASAADLVEQLKLDVSAAQRLSTK